MLQPVRWYRRLFFRRALSFFPYLSLSLSLGVELPPHVRCNSLLLAAAKHTPRCLRGVQQNRMSRLTSIVLKLFI